MWVPFLVLCYWLGAIPWAYVVSRAVAGVDIRTVGDGNVGALNVYRQVGKGPGLAVGLLDFTKGATAIYLARQWGLSEITTYAAGIAVALGHDWSPFLRFRGGQGFAASVGVLFVLMPRETLLSVALVALALLLTRNWDWSNGIGFAALPFFAGIAGQTWSRLIYLALLLLLVAVKKLLDRPIRQQLRARPPAALTGDESEQKTGPGV